MSFDINRLHLNNNSDRLHLNKHNNENNIPAQQ